MSLVKKQFVGAPFQLQALNDQLDFAQLPAFLRVLLSTDGTVTSSLEAYFWEAVAVDTLNQGTIVLPQDAPAIERKRGDEVLSRRVQLRGCESQSIYVRAESLIRMDLLSPQFRADLHNQKLGIGELLRECGLETCREVLDVSGCGSKPLDEHYLLENASEVQRTYRIVMDHQPFIQITETFPLALYR